MADAARSVRPIEVSSKEMIDQIPGIAIGDRRIKLLQIIEMIGTSYERVHNILHKVLKMKKSSARWMLR